MNDELLQHCREQIAQMVQPLGACASRKQAMQEELQSHLLTIFEEESEHYADDRAAIQAAMSRFGNADELCRQLQESVPLFERILCSFLGQKENAMSRSWITALVVVMIVWGVAIREHAEFMFGALCMLGAVGFYHLMQQDNALSRAIRPQWQVLVGSFVALIGSAIILPGLAHYKQTLDPLTLVPSALGTMMVLAGLSIAIYNWRKSRTRLA